MQSQGGRNTYPAEVISYFYFLTERWPTIGQFQTILPNTSVSRVSTQPGFILAAKKKMKFKCSTKI